jgi:hypothetical protein
LRDLAEHAGGDAVCGGDIEIVPWHALSADRVRGAGFTIRGARGANLRGGEEEGLLALRAAGGALGAGASLTVGIALSTRPSHCDIVVEVAICALRTISARRAVGWALGTRGAGCYVA